MLHIRNETQADRQTVEDITRRAFYNIYAPGCTEHYLVRVGITGTSSRSLISWPSWTGKSSAA